MYPHTPSHTAPDVEERDRSRTGETLPEGASHPAVQRHRVQTVPAGSRGQLPAQQGQVRQAKG